MSEQAHATTATYLRIAAILVMLTLIEVGVFYVPTFQALLVPILLVLSAIKFTLVVMFYMHLKFDNRFFAFLFGGPLLLGVAVVVSLLFIFYGALRLRTGRSLIIGHWKFQHGIDGMCIRRCWPGSSSWAGFTSIWGVSRRHAGTWQASPVH